MVKKFSALFTVIIVFASTSQAAFTSSETETKKQDNAVIATQKAAAAFFVSLSRQDYEQLTGRHLGIAGRLAFHLTQKSVQRRLQRAQPTEGFNATGLVLGLLLNVWGVLGAYIFSQDDNLHKWAWVGLGVCLVLVLFISLIVIGSKLK